MILRFSGIWIFQESSEIIPQQTLFHIFCDMEYSGRVKKYNSTSIIAHFFGIWNTFHGIYSIKKNLQQDNFQVFGIWN